MMEARGTPGLGADSARGLPPLVQAMMRRGFYPDSPAHVELKQTHISYVFIAGDFVYKVKKPVHFPFLNCSMLTQRFLFCCEEVRLNARLSPRVYLGVFAVLKRGDSFVLGPGVTAEHPEAVEYAVKMRRLPEDRMLDVLLAAGQVDSDTIRAIAARIAEFHASAPSNRGWTYGSAAAVWRSVIEDIAQDEVFVGHTLRQFQFATIDAFCRAFITAHWRVLNDRALAGRVREGHGDLRAEHICLLGTEKKEIDVIDCVEFSERLRYGDVASEIAFLAMDLDRLGAPLLADQLVEDYAEITGDEELAVFVPFYKCYRASVRGKVESLRSLEREVGDAERERARQLASSYFALAWRYARGAAPALIVLCGLSGSGKSTVARMLQHRKGFRAINSDRVRKRLASVSPHEHVRTDYGANIYSDKFTKITYDAMLAEAEKLLNEGCGAILDATFKTSADRQLALALAARRRVPVLFIECVVSPDEAIRRLTERASAEREVSDATPKVYERQRAEFEPIREIPPRNHLRLDTARQREHLVAEIEAALERLI
ncbi:AAA family ATPase [Candidatus Binatus sp.]|uniref:bifunctional aminoglycoside phosphotransferase/ATP-binding protein n=1 Tax=Candidatus Binatus sp. TaxID=2811406 RepID=UPI002B476F9A|nr:AAA family ATPase [Candidatus Binatus sp.]